MATHCGEIHFTVRVQASQLIAIPTNNQQPSEEQNKIHICPNILHTMSCFCLKIIRCAKKLKRMFHTQEKKDLINRYLVNTNIRLSRQTCGSSCYKYGKYLYLLSIFSNMKGVKVAERKRKL